MMKAGREINHQNHNNSSCKSHNNSTNVTSRPMWSRLTHPPKPTNSSNNPNAHLNHSTIPNPSITNLHSKTTVSSNHHRQPKVSQTSPPARRFSRNNQDHNLSQTRASTPSSNWPAPNWVHHNSMASDLLYSKICKAHLSGKDLSSTLARNLVIRSCSNASMSHKNPASCR